MGGSYPTFNLQELIIVNMKVPRYKKKINKSKFQTNAIHKLKKSNNKQISAFAMREMINQEVNGDSGPSHIKEESEEKIKPKKKLKQPETKKKSKKRKLQEEESSDEEETNDEEIFPEEQESSDEEEEEEDDNEE